jgi:hypothetical protein
MVTENLKIQHREKEREEEEEEKVLKDKIIEEKKSIHPLFTL